MESIMEQRKKEKKREYFRRYRAEHKESIRAAQIRYWNKQAQESALKTEMPKAGIYHDMMGGCT